MPVSVAIVTNNTSNSLVSVSTGYWHMRDRSAGIGVERVAPAGYTRSANSPKHSTSEHQCPSFSAAMLVEKRCESVQRWLLEVSAAL